MSGNTLWLVSIETKHGTDNSAHITRAGAERAVHQYVDYWWDEEMRAEHGDALPMPEDPQEAVTLYFEEIDDEYYNIEQIPVLP